MTTRSSQFEFAQFPRSHDHAVSIHPVSFFLVFFCGSAIVPKREVFTAFVMRNTFCFATNLTSLRSAYVARGLMRGSKDCVRARTIRFNPSQKGTRRASYSLHVASASDEFRAILRRAHFPNARYKAAIMIQEYAAPATMVV